MTGAAYGSLPFKEQIAFFRQKRLVPTERWNDLTRDQHDAGFMVAGALKADLLADLYNAVDKAIAQGTTFATFQKDFEAIVARHGWTGWTGEDTPAGRAWRARVIYDTNLRTSYQAGRWAQIQQVKGRRPYLIYKHSDAVIHPRKLHKSWDGLVVRVDDPWVKTHWPPNGWGCRCQMYSLSDRDLEKMGKSGPDTPPDDGTYEWTDKKTGEVHTFPNGIDPFWDYAPGASRVDAVRKQIEQQTERLPAGIAADLREDIAGLGLPALHSALSRAEAEIVQSEVETTVVFSAGGDELLRRVGDANSVRFTVDELPLLANAVVTHNHPVITSFSIEDVGLLIRHDLSELRAVDRQWLYRIARVGGPLTADEKQRLMTLAEEYESAGWGEAIKKLQSGTIDDIEFRENLYHWMWLLFNAEGRIIYSRDPREAS